MSHLERFGKRHPLCQCPTKRDEGTGFTMLDMQPDCPAHVVIDADEMRKIVDGMIQRAKRHTWYPVATGDSEPPQSECLCGKVWVHAFVEPAGPCPRYDEEIAGLKA